MTPWVRTLAWIVGDSIAIALIWHAYTRDGDPVWFAALAMCATDIAAEVYLLLGRSRTVRR